jgi:single-strand DNA-binding protein
LNIVAMVGRITKDLELKKLSEGRVQSSFILAVNRNFKNQKGEVDADFVLCTVWGKVAENTVKFCGKGSLVGVNGRIQSRTYEREDGTRVFVTEVVADEVRFLATKQRADNSSPRTDPLPPPPADFHQQKEEEEVVAHA